MKKQLLLLILVFFCVSCVSFKKEVITKSTIKLEGKNTNIRDFIDIDGHYQSSKQENGSLMFFEDGTYVYFPFKENAPASDIRNNLSKSIRKWEEGKQVRWGIYWGVYKIENDTIIVHSYDKPAFLKPLDLSEIRYKIIDRETIKGIFYKIRTDDEYYKIHSPWRDATPIHFIPADSLPSSDCWLKEEKWIWRNESDWKAYMEKIEVEKKKPAK